MPPFLTTLYLMKNLFLWMVLLIYGLPAAGQQNLPNNRVKFGLEVGTNISSMIFEDGAYESMHYTPGIRAGFMIERNLIYDFIFHTGLELQSKGDEYLYGSRYYQETVIIKPIYLEIPCLLAYQQGLFFARAGPTLAFGIGGKRKTNGFRLVGGATYTHFSNQRPIVWGTDDNIDLKIYEVSVRFEAGVMIKKFRLGGSVERGISNINASYDYKAANRFLSLFAGYMFR